MGEDLVLDDRGIIMDEDMFNRKGGNFRKENTSECVGD